MILSNESLKDLGSLWQKHSVTDTLQRDKVIGTGECRVRVSGFRKYA